MRKKILFWLLSLCSLSITFAAVDLSLDTIVMPTGTGLYQYTTPTVKLILKNSWSNGVIVSNANPIATGFITCSVWWQNVFVSDPISSFVLNPHSSLQFSINLSNIATKNLGEQSLLCTLHAFNGWIVSVPSYSISYHVLEKQWGRFDMIMDSVRDPLKNKIDWPVAEVGVGWLKTFIYDLIDRFAVRGAVLVWVLFALLALVKIMFTDDENSLSQVKWLLIWWLVGIMIILSAKFIGNTFYSQIMKSGELWQNEFSLIHIASQIYDLILYPLLKIAFYVMMSILFVLLLIRVFSFVTSTAEEVRKKSMQIIISTTIGLFVIISAKQLVEWVYGKESLIRNSAAVTITDVGWAFLKDANIPIIYQIIQRVMGLSGFVILALIIFQTYQLLINPTDEKTLWSLRKTLLYAVLGMLVIGAWYLIVNVVMVN